MKSTFNFTFNELRKHDRLELTGKFGRVNLSVKSKSYSKKYDVSKAKLIDLDAPKTCPYFLYESSGRLSIAHSDLAITGDLKLLS